MRFLPKSWSIRTRLFIIYIGILLIGFGALTLIASRQISSGAREDYEQRLKSEIVLIAQGVAPTSDDYLNGTIDDDDLKTAFSQYEASTNGTLTFIQLSNQPQSHEGPRQNFRDAMELESAIRGEITLDERPDDTGHDRLYTATQIIYDGRLQGLLQLSVPASNLQTMIAERWLELGLVFGFVALLGVGAAFWLARSIIQPLYKLRESAVRLSQGDFSHRIHYEEKDEIGEVAHAFNEMATQVESMLEEQRAFASNTSHELRTPLTTIRLRTEALRFDPTLEAPIARQYIEEIDDEVVRLGNLIQDLTLLSRFDAGRAELGREQVDMGRFATSLVNQINPLAKDKNISITLNLPAESITMNASLNHLTVVFRNLLDNAIKYTPPAGNITWKIEKANQLILHTICDSGHGIEQASLPHLFERFYRVDKAHSRNIPGTGLGLALVKSIVEAYDGHITIESNGLDQGTRVKVSLPQRANLDNE